MKWINCWTSDWIIDTIHRVGFSSNELDWWGLNGASHSSSTLGKWIETFLKNCDFEGNPKAFWINTKDFVAFHPEQNLLNQCLYCHLWCNGPCSAKIGQSFELNPWRSVTVESQRSKDQIWWRKFSSWHFSSQCWKVLIIKIEKTTLQMSL